jgi:hypothetical protein
MSWCYIGMVGFTCLCSVPHLPMRQTPWVCTLLRRCCQSSAHMAPGLASIPLPGCRSAVLFLRKLAVFYFCAAVLHACSCLSIRVGRAPRCRSCCPTCGRALGFSITSALLAGLVMPSGGCSALLTWWEGCVAVIMSPCSAVGDEWVSLPVHFGPGAYLTRRLVPSGDEVVLSTCAPMGIGHE